MDIKNPLKVKYKQILVMKLYFYFHNVILHMKRDFKVSSCEFRRDTKKKVNIKSL